MVYRFGSATMTEEEVFGGHPDALATHVYLLARAADCRHTMRFYCRRQEDKARYAALTRMWLAQARRFRLTGSEA